MESIKNSFHLMLSLTVGIYIITMCSGSDRFFDSEDITTLNHSSGILTFSDPMFKKHNVFLWQIVPNITNHSVKSVSLFFETLFLHENDMVTIFKNLSDTKNDSNSIVSPITAQNGSVTISTDLLSLFVKLQGNDTSYIRKFETYYESKGCFFPLKPDVQILHSPVYIGKNSSVECKYTYNHVANKRLKPLFQFDVYNFSKSTVHLEQTTYPSVTYDKKTPMDFFPAKGHNAMSLTVNLEDKDETFCLLVRQVDSACSDYTLINSEYPKQIKSPKYVLDNGTLGEECVWIIQHKDNSKILGVTFAKLHLSSVLDIISINDGATFNSQPLFQVTTSQSNTSMNQVLRSSGPYLWITFKPLNFVSEMVANIMVHGQGGHFTGSGHISVKNTTGNDAVFTLNVGEKEIVMLNFVSSDFHSPATVTIYDGYDLSNLITTLHGDILYPILSQSSKMMIVATGFNKGVFEADFKGVSPGCMHMSTLTNENYVLSGNCNNTCEWIVPPQNVPESTLLLHFQYISLAKEDVVEIKKLDAAKTVIGSIDATQNHVPTVSIPAAIGAMVKITRKACSKPDDVVLMGHSGFIPVCGGVLVLNSTETFRITSPLFPDTYPLFSNCNWTLVTPKNSLVHLAFDKIALAPQHCVKVFNALTTSEYSGSNLPDDLFLSNNSVVEFISDKCKASKAPLQLVSSEGFLLNGTVAECGAVFEGKLRGTLNVNVSTLTQTQCMWKVSVPASNNAMDGSVNIIAYSISAIEEKGNYEMKIFDGATIREPQIVNVSSSEVWTRKNSMIIFYKRLNSSLPSTVFKIAYQAITCNSSMLCENKLCMHPDWVCNGHNDCGDYSDEKNCDTSPIIKQYGYSATTFWVTLFCMLGTGLVFGIAGKVFHEKYKNGQYHRFSDISVIE